LNGGFLRRCDEPEAVLALLRVMANTPVGSWAGCPRFGLRDLMEQNGARREKVDQSVQAMNQVLQELGVVNFRVETVTRESPAGSEVSQWVVTLAATSDPGKTFSFAWSAS
jgi:hypothetical protein